MRYTEGLLALLCLWATTAVSFAQQTMMAPRPAALADTAAVRALGVSDISGSHIWSIVPATDSSGQYVLLRDGTQFQLIDSANFVAVLGDSASVFRDHETSPEPFFRPSQARQQPYFGWIDFRADWSNPLLQLPEGLAFRYGGAGSYGERWFNESIWDFSAAKLVGPVHLEATWGATEESMNLQQAIRKEYGSSEFSDWRFSMAAALPYVRYTLRRESGAVPKYFWLDTGIVGLYQSAVNGEDSSNNVVSQFSHGMDGHAWNFSHTLELRWWILRYSMLIDNDVYVAPIHTFGLEGMDMGIGTWDLHLIVCNGRWASGMALDFGPYTVWNGQKVSWKWKPLRLEFDYAEWSRMRVAAFTEIQLDGLWKKEMAP